MTEFDTEIDDLDGSETSQLQIYLTNGPVAHDANKELIKINAKGKTGAKFYDPVIFNRYYNDYIR